MPTVISVSPAACFSSLLRILLMLVTMVYGATAAALAIDEAEPNNPCFAAQQIGAFDFPTTVTGSLDSIPEQPDVDFFQFQGVAGQAVVVDLEGVATGAGSLSDPFLGLFNSECALLAINDDGGSGLNSRFSFNLPDDGVFVLGVTTCCDSGFIGGGQGSYTLTVDELLTITSIDGRLVNANSGEPLPGAELPYALAHLLRCNGEVCDELIGSQQVGTGGEFSFQSDQFGNPLAATTYQIQAVAFGYENFTSAPFATLPEVVNSVGDLGLLPLQVVGSISGRLVDALSADPLPGNIPPYPIVYLERCEEFGCFIVAGFSPDDAGEFRFDGITYNLSPATYRLSANAEGYQQSVSAQMPVAAFEHADFGDFPLTPLPIQFGAIQPCVIPPGGGLCEYSIDVRYRGTARRFRGEAWSTVEFYRPPTYQVTRFQVGRNGVENPNPQRLNLGQGQTETLTFQLDIPADVPDFSTVCGYIAVGQGRNAQFNSGGDRFIFCSSTQGGALVPMSEKEGRKHLKNIKERRESAFDTRHQRRNMRDKPARSR
ncbi:hypothetical protein G8764_00360 [Pseudomaricurvus alcaniphilus]|uniref:pre-peptidase C-terminal domain-containing protein n=1 Tax=Pseudomaricurvus alcaniphilus TaxID=1166482 RepID=UPI001407C0C8|nr:pre-peptidase C-terminal domain-containing protein [Pseudomaricurvus alcaniphilus]NHN35742.1 hypothetical protein [Pseudomaricurvus alcaniphilus]